VVGTAAVAAATIVEEVVVIVQIVVVVVVVVVAVVVVVVVVVVVHHCQNPEQYCIFILPHHMLEVVNFTTGSYESVVASSDRFSILLKTGGCFYRHHEKKNMHVEMTL